MCFSFLQFWTSAGRDPVFAISAICVRDWICGVSVYTVGWLVLALSIWKDLGSVTDDVTTYMFILQSQSINDFWGGFSNIGTMARRAFLRPTACKD